VPGLGLGGGLLERLDDDAPRWAGKGHAPRVVRGRRDLTRAARPGVPPWTITVIAVAIVATIALREFRGKR
jgi:hypothetical protein